MALFLFIPGILVALAVFAWRGVLGAEGWCAGCGYDLRRTPGLRCPECGLEHASRAAMRRPRRMKKTAAVLAALALVSVVGIAARISHWTELVPRPVLSVLLDVMVDPPPATGGPLPTPTAAFQYSSDPWERLVWQRQVGHAVEAWAGLVITDSEGATLEEVRALLPAAVQIEALYDEFGGTSATESWPVKRAVGRVLRRAERARARLTEPAAGAVRFDRGAWALSELQFEGADYTHRPDWASPPKGLLVALLTSGDAELQLFALERVGRFQEGLAEVMAVVRELAGAKDPAVASRAADLAGWMEAFGPPEARENAKKAR